MMMNLLTPSTSIVTMAFIAVVIIAQFSHPVSSFSVGSSPSSSSSLSSSSSSSTLISMKGTGMSNTSIRHFVTSINMNRRSDANYNSDDNDNDNDNDFEFARVGRRRRRRDRYSNDDEGYGGYENENSAYSSSSSSSTSSSRSRQRQGYDKYYDDDEEDIYDEVDFDEDDEDDDDYYYDDDDDDDDEYDEYDEAYNDVIPNALLDQIDPDGAIERMPQLLSDPQFYRDVAIVVVLFMVYAFGRLNNPLYDITDVNQIDFSKFY